MQRYESDSGSAQPQPLADNRDMISNHQPPPWAAGGLKSMIKSMQASHGLTYAAQGAWWAVHLAIVEAEALTASALPR